MSASKGRIPRRGLSRALGRRGLVLVASVGVLGVVSVMGLAFATVMRLEARAARNYTEAVRAEFVARAGIEDAITRLRILARKGFELPYDVNGKLPAWADWYTWRGTAGGGHKTSYPARANANFFDDDDDGQVDEGDEKGLRAYTDWLPNTYSGGDTYTVTVVDAASKININAGDNLGTVLDNLCRVVGPPLSPARQEHLVPKWFALRNRDYRTRYTDDDKVNTYDLFYRKGADKRPLCFSNDGSGVGAGPAVYGDGFAIAGYRAEHGEFLAIEDVRDALTWNERGDGDGDGDPDGPETDMPEERMEVEAKFAAIRPYITIDSWFDTDQIGYGKFEQIKIEGTWATEFTDRNKTWNIKRNPDPAGFNLIDDVTYAGELKGCFLAIVNGVGQGQLKTIAGNSIDTIFLSESTFGSAMRVPPNHDSSYIIIGKDGVTNRDWRRQLKLYARQPLSFHRAPVNANTASDKVLVALLMGLQTNWGPAGYYTQGTPGRDGLMPATNQNSFWADALWQCPSIISVGRDENNAYLAFGWPCPNDSVGKYSRVNDVQQVYGHARGNHPYCFFCSYGHLSDLTARNVSRRTYVGEAHYLAWQILKEREQTFQEDIARGGQNANGYGPFKGWDDLFFRVFWPWEKSGLVKDGGGHMKDELAVKEKNVVGRAQVMNWAAVGMQNMNTLGHPGLARLCMANFNSNTDILKFQPNMEWIDRWGPNFTDLYLPRPDLLEAGKNTADVKLRIRPGELLDKTDLNVGTTEFAFDSGGVYEVESTGRVYDRRGVVAERKFAALIKIYDVWRESVQREFVCGEIQKAAQSRGDNATAQRTGQIALDLVRYDGDTVVNGEVERKALCTYPEAIVPGDSGDDGATPDYLLGNGWTRGANPGEPLVVPALARGAQSGFGPHVAKPPNVEPAGYDGQIMLATNSYITGRYGSYFDAPKNNVGDIFFYLGFTGDVVAEYAGGSAYPKMQFGIDPATMEPGVVEKTPLDLASVLGIVDDTEFDLPPVQDQLTGAFIEGEGRGGDLRPDGCYLGVVGSQELDGSLCYTTAYNFVAQASDGEAMGLPLGPANTNQNASWLGRATICMWVKPNWHHGTRMPASLPVNYDPKGSDWRGSHVSMRAYDRELGKTLWNTYDYQGFASHGPSSIGYKAVGYVRDRFEHQFFQASKARTDKATGNWSHYFHMVKTGDIANSIIDMDSKIGFNASSGALQSSNVGWTEFGSLEMGYEWNGDTDDWDCWMPGMLYPDGLPYYQMCPFRWFFIGATWNHFPYASQFQGQGTAAIGMWEEGGHEKYGHPLERDVWHNAPDGRIKDDIAVQRASEDPTEHAYLVLMGRPFIDTMRTWNKKPLSLEADGTFTFNDTYPLTPPTPLSGENVDYYGPLAGSGQLDFEDWCYEQYGTMYHSGHFPLGKPVINDVWGINRVSNRGGTWNENMAHLYQRAFSGTYATIDEYRIHDWKDASRPGKEWGWDWPRDNRSYIGRYYLPEKPSYSENRPGMLRKEPRFRSQTLYRSESVQTYTFAPGEETEDIELCTVRWTAFTPFYIVDKWVQKSLLTTDEWRFPYNEYFASCDGTSRFKNRYSPYQIKRIQKTGGASGDARIRSVSQRREDVVKYGVASRYSSQRGCKVTIEVDKGAVNVYYPSRNDIMGTYAQEQFYEDPEAWSPIIASYTTGRHGKCKPTELRYNVHFRLSEREYVQTGGLSVLLDSPVFDDITITYMRRPKVLQWRDVTE